MKRIAAAVLAALFLAGVSVAPAAAQATQTPATQAPATKKPAKKPSAAQMAQRQKMTDCAAKWGDHKKATGAKGKKAYNAFMKPCLKG